jgi:hypothetical protein
MCWLILVWTGCMSRICCCQQAKSLENTVSFYNYLLQVSFIDTVKISGNVQTLCISISSLSFCRQMHKLVELSFKLLHNTLSPYSMFFPMRSRLPLLPSVESKCLLLNCCNATNIKNWLRRYADKSFKKGRWCRGSLIQSNIVGAMCPNSQNHN